MHIEVLQRLLVVAACSGVGDTVAVSPPILAPNVPAEVGQAVFDRVVTASSKAPDIQIVDRSLTRSVVQEQDLLLVSRASAVLPPRFGEIGADRAFFTFVRRTTAGYSVRFSLTDIGTGEMLKAEVHQVPGARDLIDQCEGWTKSFWGKRESSNVDGLSIDDDIEEIWRQLDNRRARVLIGRDLERAESAYRTYIKTVQAGEAREAERLSRVAGNYLTECLSLYLRATDPPEGLVYIPPGRITVPVSPSKSRRFEVDGFFMDRCEFTRQQYAQFLVATGRAKPLAWSDPTTTTANLPVVGVDWYDADAAAAWRGMRLPTYAQYLRAVMGDDKKKYPWGDLWRSELCNSARGTGLPVLEPVGSHPGNAGSFGVLDGVGGVFEWLETWQGARYWERAPARNPRGPEQGSAKLAVGGSFRCGPEGCTCSSVQPLTPGTRKDDVGFRCVLSLKGDPARPGNTPDDGFAGSNGRRTLDNERE